MSAQFLENNKNQIQINIVKFKPLKIGVFSLMQALICFEDSNKYQ